MNRFLYLLPLVLLFACGDGPATTADTPASTTTEADTAPPISTGPTFTDNATETVFDHYLELRTALVSDDGAMAAAAASNLSAALGDRYPELKQAATVIATTQDVAAQRAAFAAMTEELEPVLSDNISGGAVYKQYCPMAFDNTGAEWFSDVQEIRNPYFGDRMLKCGKVVATLE